MAYLSDHLTENNMRDENEKRIFKTIRENDIETLKEILKNPVDCRLGFKDIPILSVAVLLGDCAMIKHLINSGCDSREVDGVWRSAFHMITLWPPSSDDQKRQLDIVEILLSTCSNTVEAVFSTANFYKMTPFLSACKRGHDAIILRFLALVDNTNSISMDHLIGYLGNNVFHFLCDSWRDFMPPTVNTVRALIDKFQYSNQLIDAKNDGEDTPLHKLLIGNEHDSRELADLANLFFQLGASPDTQNRNGATYLDGAIRAGNVSFVETILRVGFRTKIFQDESPLSRLLKGYMRSPDSPSFRMIELLLAFGHDLQKELFLYTIEERPIEFTSPEYASRRDTSGMNTNVLEALKELRRSNKMLSLRRQCRNTIRRYLKAKADEVIGSLTCIPDRIKSFLLVENEARCWK